MTPSNQIFLTCLIIREGREGLWIPGGDISSLKWKLYWLVLPLGWLWIIKNYHLIIYNMFLVCWKKQRHHAGAVAGGHRKCVSAQGGWIQWNSGNGTKKKTISRGDAFCCVTYSKLPSSDLHPLTFYLLYSAWKNLAIYFGIQPDMLIHLFDIHLSDVHSESFRHSLRSGILPDIGSGR